MDPVPRAAHCLSHSLAGPYWALMGARFESRSTAVPQSCRRLSAGLQTPLVRSWFWLW